MLFINGRSAIATGHLHGANVGHLNVYPREVMLTNVRCALDRRREPDADEDPGSGAVGLRGTRQRPGQVARYPNPVGTGWLSRDGVHTHYNRLR
jgi:hypothetical protein